MENKPALQHILIGIGSNLDPERNVPAALSLLENAVTVLSRASIWQSAAIGHQGPDYLNTAVLVAADQSIDQVENLILRPIEDQLGRVRGPDKFADRTIDLDVLVFNMKVIDPEIWSQPHASLPAAEILPDLINPISGLSLAQTAHKLQAGSNIKLRADLQF